MPVAASTAGQQRTIWMNWANARSLRLTEYGYQLILKYSKDTPDHAWHFQLSPGHGMTNGMLLKLDRLMTAPYFIKGRTHIFLIGEQDAMMLTLHGNDLARYLANLESSQ